MHSKKFMVLLVVFGVVLHIALRELFQLSGIATIGLVGAVVGGIAGYVGSMKKCDANSQEAELQKDEANIKGVRGNDENSS